MLSENIYALRRRSGLSQEQLAEKIGVSRQSVSKWESGQSTPELDKLAALCACFQVTMDQLTANEAAENLFATRGEPPAAAAPGQDRQPDVPVRPEPAPADGGAVPPDHRRLGGRQKAGLALCLLGAAGLVLFAALALAGPGTAEHFNQSSTATLNGSALLALLAVAALAAGLLVILKQK